MAIILQLNGEVDLEAKCIVSVGSLPVQVRAHQERQVAPDPPPNMKGKLAYGYKIDPVRVEEIIRKQVGIVETKPEGEGMHILGDSSESRPPEVGVGGHAFGISKETSRTRMIQRSKDILSNLRLKTQEYYLQSGGSSV
ncbi:hypothetical protein SCHPADRAFT_577488 [Schizopora paradoxa]|uniref:Uncharacterized protein n=1 Tax=Schizopora paradoxa TaxID=27342 RepID=A0A0H2RCI0_9AGAM|nr:hypothetical protein SCHPADRAFT_577488 [Schizopora paradoxa]